MKVTVKSLILLWNFTILGHSDNCNYTGIEDCVKTLKTMVFRHHSDSAITYSDSLLQVLSNRKLSNCKDGLWVKLAKGEAYEFKMEFHKALEQYHEILPIAVTQEYWEIIAETYLSLARAHEASGRLIDCKRYLDDAHEVILAHNLERVKARLSYRASSYFRMSFQLDTAKVLAHKAVQLGEKYPNTRAIGDGYMLLGMLESDAELKSQYFKAGRDINIQEKAYHSVIVLNMSVARAQKELGNLDFAEQLARETFYYDRLLTEELGYEGFYNHFGKNQAHQLLAKIYEAKGDRDSLDYHLGLANYYEKKMNWSTDQAKMSEIETKNAVEVVRLKLALLETKLHTAYFLSFLSVFLIVIGGIFTYSNIKKKNKIRKQNILIFSQNSQLTEFNEKQGMLLSEVHHRVKNNLQNVISLLTIQGMKINSKNTQTYVSDVCKKIHSIALIHDQLYQTGEFDKIEMNSYLSNLLFHFNAVKNGDYKLKTTLNTNGISLNLESVIPIGITCAELITNSLKHVSDVNTLEIQLELTKLDSNQYSLHFRDNGSGYSNDSLQGINIGFGMSLIQSMARQLKAKVEFYNRDGANTKFIFDLKTVSKI